MFSMMAAAQALPSHASDWAKRRSSKAMARLKTGSRHWRFSIAACERDSFFCFLAIPDPRAAHAG